MIACTSVVYVAISAFLLRRAGISAREHHIDTGWRLRVRPHLMWTALMAAVGVLGSRSIETFLLNRWAGAADVGFFAIAMSLTRAGIDLLAAGLSTVMMPIMGYVLGTGDRPRMQRVFADATRYYQFMGLMIAGVGLFWAHVIVSVMYGEHYLPVVPIFRIMVATTGILLANGAFSALLASSDHQRFRVGVMLFSLAISWTVAIALIPKYGMFGAAYAQMISAVLYTIVIVIGIQKSVGLVLPWGALAKQYAVALAAGGISMLVLAFGGTGTVAEIAAGILYAVLYLVLSIATGVWRDDEKKHIADLMRRYPYLDRFAGLLILDAERGGRR
jgi:O-antigen/teichoic acid export membrane protein